jgi:DNA-binding transcriptional ArsR family regulator
MQRTLDVLSALADPTRLKIMLLVRDIELAMGELADVLDQSQPRVSRHVRILAEAGLVRRHKEGAWVFVGLGNNLPFAELYALIAAIAQGRDGIAAERARLAAVRADRQRAADQWFADNAAEWDLMHQLHGTDGALDAALHGALDAAPIGRLLDIGTGTGRLLAAVGARATQAVGIDRSPEMLRLARARLDAAGRCARAIWQRCRIPPLRSIRSC